MIKGKDIILKSKLKGIIAQIGHMNEVKQEIGEEFKSRNMSALRAAWVFSEQIDLDTLTDSENDLRFLFIFSYALNKALDGKNEIKIDLDEYFTEVEINNWSEYKEDKEPDNIYPIIFKDVSFISDGYWQAVISAKEMERLNSHNVFIYNPNTQRKLKVTKQGIRIDVDPIKVNEIKERMLDGEQFADDIKFNILNTGNEQPPYHNPKTRTLTVYEGCIINTFDGQNRKTANSAAISENPELDFNWPIKIAYYSEIKAYDFMTQINKQTKIDEKYLAPKDYSKEENRVIDIIMDTKSEFSKATKDSDNYITADRGLVTKYILALAIKENYKDDIKDNPARMNIGNWIAEFMDYLMGLFVDEFINNPYKVKKTSYINHKNMFYGYIALSEKLQNNSNWKELLKKKMGSIDFSKDNSMWKDVGLVGNSDANKTLRGKLYKLFKEGI